MYHVAIATLSDGRRIAFGTDRDFLTNEEAGEHIRSYNSSVTQDVIYVSVVPNDGYPYFI
jgi:hypothetical protein